jgi:hypothetical protein
MLMVRHLVRAAKVLARDAGVPRWLRWLFVFGLLPIPLFVDELTLVVASAILFVFHRRRVVQAWTSTRWSEAELIDDDDQVPATLATGPRSGSR